MTFEIDVAVVGGCGHAGLPLGLAFAHRGRSVEPPLLEHDELNLSSFELHSI